MATNNLLELQAAAVLWGFRLQRLALIAHLLAVGTRVPPRSSLDSCASHERPLGAVIRRTPPPEGAA